MFRARNGPGSPWRSRPAVRDRLLPVGAAALDTRAFPGDDRDQRRHVLAVAVDIDRLLDDVAEGLHAAALEFLGGVRSVVLAGERSLG